MNVKQEFIEWFIDKNTYKSLPKSTIQKYIEGYVEFLDFDPFELNDDLSDIKDVKERIISRTLELKKNQDYIDFQYKSSRNAPEAILGKNNFFVFLDDLKNQSIKGMLDLSAILNQPEIQSIIKEPQFYFQKGQDALNEWMNLTVSEELKNNLIILSKDYIKFQEEATKRDDLKQVLELLFKIVAYCDTHAKDKYLYNQYDNKRTLAFAFVRMNNWIEKLIQFKFSPGEVGAGSPKNAFDYLLDPINNSTILSENHRKQLSENFLKKSYNPSEFVSNLINYFEDYNLTTTNPQNYTHLLMWIVYSFQDKWKNKKPVNITTQFADIIEQVKTISEDEPEIKNLFGFEKTANTYVWIKDKSGLIGNTKAHYEIIRKKDNLFVEVHFEGKQHEKDVFRQKMKILPDKLDWFKWNKASSITLKDNFHINDPDIADKLVQGLLYLEESIGDQLREIIKSMNIVPKSGREVHSLNQILYGPPGTGKTYNTINKAIAIANPDFSLNQSREIIKKEYDRLVEEGQIMFTTFHQSMSYEDFIEGIKPVLINETEESDSIEPGKVAYEIQDGLFKKLCKRAQGVSAGTKKIKKEIDFDSAAYFKMSIGGKSKPQIHEWCINHNKLALGWGNDIDFSSYLDLVHAGNWNKFRDKFIAEHKELVDESRYHIQAMYIFLKMKKGDVVLISKGNHILDAVGVIKNDNYIFDDSQNFDYYQFREVEWIVTDLDSSPELFVKKNISQQSIYEFYSTDINKEYFKKQFAKSDETHNSENFVLIIDEINRGNIASIFGELITLIETDKRLGNSEALKVILPYSKEKFGVPSNLHIIGTMNTADRSVEALDTALRRRFCFEEMQSKPHVIATEGKLKSNAGVLKGIDLSWLLDTINKRIAKLLDKDHQIGHSYFMNVENLDDLKVVFHNKIIPLLQEYFFGDQGKTGLVLGEGFFEPREEQNDNLFADFNGYDASEFAERPIYKVKDIVNMPDPDFIKAINTLLRK